VYWRYWALDNKGNITYHPASGSFSYQDGRNCGGPVKFTNVSGPTSGAISQCANLYSVHAYDNSETLYFVKVEYASNPSFNNAKTLDLLPSGATWSGSFSIDTFAKAGTDMVYWRFWARTYQQIARYAYYPSSGSFSYSDALDCGGPTRTPSVVPTPSATASSPAATQTATVPPAASATQTATQAANSATPSPTSLPSATATSSSTAPPSATPTAAPSATPTATPSSTAPP
ncbi:MAG: hypothetical protein OEZ02_07555, partial [Anaerolineae bacterium]|nr:hypothetical protein [Anaerolineae bacterium]